MIHPEPELLSQLLFWFCTQDWWKKEVSGVEWNFHWKSAQVAGECWANNWLSTQRRASRRISLTSTARSFRRLIFSTISCYYFFFACLQLKTEKIPEENSNQLHDLAMNFECLTAYRADGALGLAVCAILCESTEWIFTKIKRSKARNTSRAAEENLQFDWILWCSDWLGNVQPGPSDASDCAGWVNLVRL